MAESFDCPKCGAPINFDADQHLDQQTMSCPYCGDSIIIPKNLRRSAPQPTYTRISPDIPDTNYTTITPNPAIGKDITRSISRGCVTVVIVAALIIGGVAVYVAANIKGNFNQGFGGSKPPTVDSSAAINKALSTVSAQLTQIPGMIAVLTPTAAETPTPAVDLTATAQVANNATIEQQSNWPVVLQEKFINNQRNWNVGTSNTDLALEEYNIAAGKYTWKITSKKGMGTFSYPDMPLTPDLYVSVDMQMTTTTANQNDQAGIIFRDSDKASTFYFFGVNPVGSYSLTMYDGSNWNDLISVNQTNLLKPNDVNHLAVSMQGSQILLEINNQVVDSYQDTQLTTGDAGLGTYLDAAGEDATIVFSNFYVRAPKQ
ncbi:MAG: hypothetical protein P4L50_09775 [Anaerolineaceae bacterium]|nr:hypothetical protein [Anaerolineaceae bacterium]